MTSPLDLHSRMIALAQKAVRQVKENPSPQDSLLPPDTPLPTVPDPAYPK